MVNALVKKRIISDPANAPNTPIAMVWGTPKSSFIIRVAMNPAAAPSTINNNTPKRTSLGDLTPNMVTIARI